MLRIILISLFSTLFFCFCSTQKREVDLIIHNATIYSVDSSFTIYQAMCVKDGKIVDLGKSEDILAHYQAAEITDAKGKTIFPGFIDAHCHFVGYGLGLQQVDLTGTKSYDEVLQKVIDFSGTNGIPADAFSHSIQTKSDKASMWLIGRGWDQNDWEKKDFPDKAKLDSLFPDIAVCLTRIDGHAVLVNSEALKRAGITLQTKIAGGEILKNGNELSGVLVDNAVDLVKKIIPPYTQKQLNTALLKAQENCLRYGLTTIDDAGLMKREIDAVDALHQSGELKIRVYAMLSDSTPNYHYYLEKGPYKTERLNVCSFKFYADGALGSRGACLHDDYSDKKNWKGFLLSNREHFEKQAKILVNKGFQMNTHCIGDSAYHIILNAYKKAGATKTNRWRIEHAQVVTPMDIKLSDGIIPSVQPTHATSDMYWAEERLGTQRVKHAYAYNELLKSTGIIALGTDFPVEDISTFKTFYAATIRKDSKGFPEKGFQTENALTREETLRGMTIWAAYANFEEKEKGSLEKGKLADFIILNTDLMKCPATEILHTQVISTYINGERVFTVLSY